MGQIKDNKFRKLISNLFFVLIFIVHGMAIAEPISAGSVAADIKNCKALEDDKPKQAIELANTLIEVIEAGRDPINYGHALGCLAWAYAVDNQTDKATATASDLEVLVNKLQSNEDKISLLRRAGGIFHRTGNRIAAVENYQMAMGLAEGLNLKQQQIPLLINLGVLNSQMREHSVAINDYYLALDLINETESFNYQAPVLFNLAVTLNGQERYQEGLKIYRQVEAMITEQWPDTRVAQVYTGLSAAYLGVNKVEQAKTYIDKAMLLLTKEDGNSLDLYGAKIINAQVLSELGLNVEATEQADQAWAYFKSPENRDQMLSINNPLYSLAKVYEQNSDTERTLEIYKLARSISQEFQDSFNKETMAQMQSRLSDNQQRNELTAIKKQNALNEMRMGAESQNKEQQMILSIGGLLICFGFLYWEKRTNKHLRLISMRDSLTKLGNRRAIQDWFESRKFPRGNKVRLMWLIDLDLFKRINDELGHETGDMVLIKVSETLMNHVGSGRFVGRWGGEEFMLLSDDVAEQDIEGFGQGLLKSIETMDFDCQGNEINLTASMGVSQIVDNQKTSWNVALALADKALYMAKDKGRNTMVHLKTVK